MLLDGEGGWVELSREVQGQTVRMNWCAGTWCYLKNQLRAVGRDSTELFIACCFGKWHVPNDGQGVTLHLSSRGSSLGDKSTTA